MQLMRGRITRAPLVLGLAIVLLPHAGVAAGQRADAARPQLPFVAAAPSFASPAEVARSSGRRLQVAEQRTTSVHRKSATVEARRADLVGSKQQTTFSLDLSAGVPAEVFTLANPYRVVVDLPDVTFRLPDGTGQTGKGLVTAYRYGLLSAGKARIVLDTKTPVRIRKAEMTARGHGVRLTVELVPTTAQAFGVGTGGQRSARSSAKPEIEEGAVRKPKDRVKPVILIDAGHGGVDPGTQSPHGVPEKKVVLAVAKQLKAQLAASGRYQVYMTRSRDVFVSLDQRLKIIAQARRRSVHLTARRRDRAEEFRRHRARRDRLHAFGARLRRGGPPHGREGERL